MTSVMNNNTDVDENESEEPSVEMQVESRQSKLKIQQSTQLSNHANFLQYPDDIILEYNEKVRSLLLENK